LSAGVFKHFAAGTDGEAKLRNLQQLLEVAWFAMLLDTKGTQGYLEDQPRTGKLSGVGDRDLPNSCNSLDGHSETF